MVTPYEESLAKLLAEFGRTDDVIVASFLDQATDAFRQFAPQVPTSAGTVATAEAWRAVQAGEPMPEIPAVAYQVPERQGDLVVADERFVAARPCSREGRPCVDGERQRVDGALARPGGGRNHLGRADHALLGVGRGRSILGRFAPFLSEPRQPRPQFGFLPWLAFFFVLSLRLTVRFDMGRTC